MESEVEAVARGAIQAINDRTLQARAQELLDPSFVRHDLVQLFPASHGPTGGSDFLDMILAAMPDFRLGIEDVICSEDRAMLRLRMTGVHTGQPLLGCPARGAKFSASAVFIYRVRGSRIIEAWQMFDGLAFFRLAGFLS